MKNLVAMNRISFPEFSGVIVNMMPFIMGDNNTLPDSIKTYGKIIDSCNLPDSEIGKVGYLTVTESIVSENESQRRGGVHTEGFSGVGWGTGWGRGKTKQSFGGSTFGASNGYDLDGGLYMANSIDDTCQAWDMHVKETGHLGCLAHLGLKDGHKMEKNRLYWMHDRTPHEALPFAGGKRQFFRLVTSDVSVWYDKHNTPNPLGVKPACKIISSNKFQ